MPLDIEVEGDAASIRESARWLQTMSGNIHDTGTQVRQAGTGSESSWSSEAGDSFRSVVSKAAPKIDEVSQDHAALCRELNRFADDLDTTKKRMQRAAEIAAEAGLTVTGTRIHEPGPEPAGPTPLPTDEPATPEQQQAHAAATRAQAAYARKVRAYQECSQVVNEAREQHNSALGVLNRFISGLVEKSPFTITDFTTGLAGAVAARTSSLRGAATHIASTGKIERAAKLMHSPNLGLRNQARAAGIYVRNHVNKAELERKTTATRTARMVDRLGPTVKRYLTTNLNFGAKASSFTSPILRGSVRVASKFPAVGLFITGGSIAYDVGVSDKPAGQSIASNLGGYAAGSLASAGLLAMSTPVGWAVVGGAVVGMGVGFAIDEWGDDIVEGAGDAAGWVGDQASGAANAVGDFFGEVF